MSFESDILKFTKGAEEHAGRVFRGVALEIFNRVIMRTPVGNPSLWKSGARKGYVGGRLRGNWSVSINRSSDRVLKRRDKTGSKVMQKVEQSIARLQLGDAIYLTNNLPYAQSVEHGSSTQAPKGMVMITARAFQRLVRIKNRNRRK